MQYNGKDRSGYHVVVDDTVAPAKACSIGLVDDSPDAIRATVATMRKRAAEELERANRYEFLASVLEVQRREDTERAATQKRERAAATRKRNAESRPAWMSMTSYPLD